MSVTEAVLAIDEARPLRVGTTGWTSDDLDDPDFETFWEQGHYEIVEGVLTEMPAAQIDDSGAFMKFMARLQLYLDDSGVGGTLGLEVDVILPGGMRVPRVDGVYLAPELMPKQEALHKNRDVGRRDKRIRYGRVRVIPTLVIESVSIGHEAHDRVTKRRWYAEAGVPNYWLFDSYDRSVETLILEGGAYRTEQLAREAEELRPTLFPGLSIPLSKVWI